MRKGEINFYWPCVSNYYVLGLSKQFFFGKTKNLDKTTE